MSKRKKNQMKKLAELPIDKLLKLINEGKISEEQLAELEEYKDLMEDYNG